MTMKLRILLPETKEVTDDNIGKLRYFKINIHKEG
jgi:hypothetical protein